MAAQTALLLIDVQNGLFDEAYDEEAEILYVLVDLLKQARDQQVPILYIQHGGGPGHPLEPRTPGWQIHPLVTPHSEDIIVHKSASDAFYESSLQDIIQALGVTRLVITGAQTEYCVDATCRRAASLNYDVCLVANGHTTSDNGHLTIAQIVAHHNHLLAQLAHPTHPISVLPATDIAF